MNQKWQIVQEYYIHFDQFLVKNKDFLENLKIFFNSSLIGPDKIANFLQNLLELCQFLGTINGTKKFCGWYKYDCIQIQKLNSKCGSHHNPNWPRFNKLLIITIFRLEILFLLESWFLKCKGHTDNDDIVIFWFKVGDNLWKLVTEFWCWWPKWPNPRPTSNIFFFDINKFRHQHPSPTSM